MHQRLNPGTSNEAFETCSVSEQKCASQQLQFLGFEDYRDNIRPARTQSTTALSPRLRLRSKSIFQPTLLWL